MAFCLIGCPLSLKNQWVDEQNRVYIIFSIDEVMEMMGCGNQKAVKILAELDGDKGIGLIEKKRQGLGRPNLIYIKNFLSQSSGKPEKIQKCENHTSGNVISGQAYQKTEKEKCEFHTSGTVKTGNQKVWVSQANDTEWNKTDMKKTVSIHPPFLSGRPPDPAENYRACEALIRKKIDYPALVLDAPEVRGKIDRDCGGYDGNLLYRMSHDTDRKRRPAFRGSPVPDPQSDGGAYPVCVGVPAEEYNQRA